MQLWILMLQTVSLSKMVNGKWSVCIQSFSALDDHCTDSNYFMRDNSGFSILPKGWDLSYKLFPGETDRVTSTTKY